MTFSDLAKYLQQLESTPSRNDMTVILAAVFKAASPDEARLIAYLSQGQLGPAYNAPDFGVADKQMLKALGGDANELFKKFGDLGLVAEFLAQRHKGTKAQSIDEVYRRLLEVAEVSGNGSQEKKQQLISKLLSEIDPISAKYVVRIILAKLRTGFSDMTILDSLSWMLAGDKSLRKNIEEIYNVRADLGEVVQLVKNLKFEIRNLKIDPKNGTPVLMAKAERAITAEDVWERNGECAVEYKLDGLRVQAHITTSEVVLFSRGLENVTPMFPDIVAGLKKQIKKPCIVEGEMIAIGKDGKTLEFKKTMNRKRKHGIAEKADEIPMAIFLFDVLYLDDKNLISTPNSDRWQILEKLVTPNVTVKLMPRIIARSSTDIDNFFRKALSEGMEGIVAKKLDAPYTPGSRDFSWIKMKSILDSVDVVVMGYSSGEGKRVGFGIGEFLVGVYEPKSDEFLTICKVGSGATDEEWVKLEKELNNLRVDKKPERYKIAKQYDQDFWVQPKLVLEIVCNEISESPAHTSGFGLRFPRLISWREKKPEDATTINEIKDMFKLNKKGGE